MPRALVSRVFLIVLLAMTLSGCAVVGGIFKAGMWVGIIIAVLVVALVVFIFGKARG
jgi:hypothetical protein